MPSANQPSSQDLISTVAALRHDVDRHEKLLAQLLTPVQDLAKTGAREDKQDWLPPANHSAVKSDDLLAIRPLLRKIPKVPKPTDETVKRFKATWLGTFYVAQLKRHRLIFRLANWIWAHTYPPYVRFVAVHLNKDRTKKWLPLTTQGDFAQAHAITPVKLADAAVVETSTPAVFPACDQGHLVTPHDRYSFPPIFVTEIGNGVIYGGTNLVLTSEEVICHDLYDFERDYTSEELHGRTLINAKPKRIRWLLHDEAPEPIPVAATFLDACAGNYAHWMTEVLPRIVLFCAEERFRGVPIVVNDGLHDNIMESLFLLVGAEREIVTLPIGRALAVAELYVTSAAGYVPFERRTRELLDHSHGLFSPTAFGLLRDRLNELGKNTRPESWPERIYLRRGTGARKVTNASEIERNLIARGYVIVEPEKLTFLQQIRLFTYAKEIISPTGAALANAICCGEGTHVAILMSKHQDMIYRYWSNLLNPLGIQVSYALGNIIENHDFGIHGDYAVDVSHIDDLLNNFTAK